MALINQVAGCDFCFRLLSLVSYPLLAGLFYLSDAAYHVNLKVFEEQADAI